MTKTELFKSELQETASIFSALGHPARLAILEYLAETKVCISGDISGELPLSRSTVNQHLEVLKTQQLIKGDISGNKVNYCLNTKKIKEIKSLLDVYMNRLESCKNQQC
jgi:DNA-binding transcriptional ArsR family regulator